MTELQTAQMAVRRLNVAVRNGACMNVVLEELGLCEIVELFFVLAHDLNMYSHFNNLSHSREKGESDATL